MKKERKKERKKNEDFVTNSSKANRAKMTFVAFDYKKKCIGRVSQEYLLSRND